jgi:peptidoglycan/xylan/chitin deacetylase (PgdA/CDA1 family)
LNNSISFLAIAVFTVIALMLIIITLEIYLPINIMTYGQQHQLNDSNNDSKVVILTFGDTYKSQFTTAKPILDQYGFKASFFITCSYAEDQKNRRSI